MWKLLNGRWVFAAFLAPETEGAGEEPEGEEPEGEEPEGGDEHEGDEPEGTESEGDEPEGTESEGDEPEEPAAPQRRENRFQRLANEARTEREARIRAEARATALEEARTTPPANAGEAERIRAEKLALMDPAEKKEFLRDERLAQLERSALVTQVQLADATDRNSFEALATVDPLRAKYKMRVEAELATMRKNGTNAPRESVFTYLLGVDAKQKLELARTNPKGSAKKKAEAEERVKSSKGAPTSARGDGGSKRAGKGDSLADLEARLKGQVL